MATEGPEKVLTRALALHRLAIGHAGRKMHDRFAKRSEAQRSVFRRPEDPDCQPVRAVDSSLDHDMSAARFCTRAVAKKDRTVNLYTLRKLRKSKILMNKHNFKPPQVISQM